LSLRRLLNRLGTGSHYLGIGSACLRRRDYFDRAGGGGRQPVFVRGRRRRSCQSRQLACRGLPTPLRQRPGTTALIAITSATGFLAPTGIGERCRRSVALPRYPRHLLSSLRRRELHQPSPADDFNHSHVRLSK